MIEHSSDITALAVALAKAQAQVKGAKKDEDNPFFKSKYADLASVWEACREALTSNGLSVVQLPGYADGVVTVDTMLLHVSGQWIRGTAGTKVAKDDPQGVGSAITYLRRYALSAVASVAPEDDDAEGAMKRSPKAVVEKGLPKAPQPLTERPAALKEDGPMPWEPPEEVKGHSPAWNQVWPFGSLKGTPLWRIPSNDLVAQKAWALKSGKALDLVDTMDDILASRAGE
jgi:hypothetical protein